MASIIEVEGLGKRYRIANRVPYGTLRESLVSAAGAPMRMVRGAMGYGGRKINRGEDQMWALRDVSFKVTPGEVLGVIGRNGAGKSTLLKILSRITDPTEGRAELRGRVGSLLEVGTGFHPELTGRENTYLSGTILGMRRSEIARNFDEIVDFAGINQFVDTPVKHYSSGMYVRLAFAVAAHLETEILLVDEVLAVGDAAFQKKCLKKMNDVAHEGRTVLLVSHNMASIQGLCESCLLIKAGCVEAKGRSSEITMRYMTSELRADGTKRSLVDHGGRRAGSIPIMRAVSLYSGHDGPVGAIRMGSSLSIHVEFSSPKAIRPVLGVAIKTAEGAPILGMNNRWTNYGFDMPAFRAGEAICTYERLPLMPGTYTIELDFGDFGDITQDLDIIREATSFEVIAADLLGSGRLPRNIDGPVFWPATWRFTDAASEKR